MLQYHGGIVFGKSVNKPHLLANTILSFLVITLFNGRKFLYKMLPVRELDAEFLFEQTTLILDAIKNNGGNVVAIVCDGNRVNQKFYYFFDFKCQSKYLKNLKEELPSNSAIVLGDFAENYSFVVQDEVQGFYWNNLQDTLHPVVYYKVDQVLHSTSYCIISDDNNHDVAMVYEVQKSIINNLKKPSIVNLIYFSDGFSSQYKNCKIICNLCQHKSDLGINSKCVFFATSHGKQPCDGIGGTVKWLVDNGSLQ